MGGQITRDWKSIEIPQALLIGHDPRLNNSNTIADHALFADYYFKPMPINAAEKRKYGLAKVSFEQIIYLSKNRIKPEEVYVTNLCNYSLPHAPQGRTVFIPRVKAQEGLENIREILKNNPTIKYIFPMSLQVNHWLQKLGFYKSSEEFVNGSEPNKKGMEHQNPYYHPKTGRIFLMVCGNQYKIENGSQILIPILHSKNFPINGRLIPYRQCYERIMQYFD